MNCPLNDAMHLSKVSTAEHPSPISALKFIHRLQIVSYTPTFCAGANDNFHNSISFLTEYFRYVMIYG
jgi:hypothetical protein